MKHTDAADIRLLITARIESFCESKPSGQDRQTNSAQIWELLDFICFFFLVFVTKTLQLSARREHHQAYFYTLYKTVTQ